MPTFVVQFWVDLSYHQRRHQFFFSNRPLASSCSTARAERLLSVSSTAQSLRPMSPLIAHTRHVCSTIRLFNAVAIALTYYVSTHQPSPLVKCVGRPTCVSTQLHTITGQMYLCVVSFADCLLDLDQPLPTATHFLVDSRRVVATLTWRFSLKLARLNVIIIEGISSLYRILKQFAFRYDH